MATALSSAVAGATHPPLYLREGLALSIAAPTAVRPLDDVVAFVGAGQRLVLAEFLSPAVEETVYAGHAVATLYLATGRVGMPECAVVAVELARRSPPDSRTVVALGELETTILPRHDTVEPIEVDLLPDGVLAEPGDRIALTVAVENRCSDARNPILFYDALGAASVVAFDDVRPTTLPPTSTTTTTIVTTTTSTTTTTTTTAPAVVPTTTTLPPTPDDCFFEPLTGWELVWCHLDTLDQTLRDEPPDVVGGVVGVVRLQRRLERVRQHVASAQSGDRPRRPLRRALQQLAAVDRTVRRWQRQGRMDPDVAFEVAELTSGAAGALSELD